MTWEGSRVWLSMESSADPLGRCRPWLVSPACLAMDTCLGLAPSHQAHLLIPRTARVLWDAPQNATQTSKWPRPSAPPSPRLPEGRPRPQPVLQSHLWAVAGAGTGHSLWNETGGRELGAHPDFDAPVFGFKWQLQDSAKHFFFFSFKGEKKSTWKSNLK